MSGHILSPNQKVVNFAKSRDGNVVGEGNCTNLAEEALAYAGAQDEYAIMGDDKVKEDSDYEWGDLVKDVKDIRPGDIIQFRNYVVKTDDVTVYKFPDDRGHFSDKSPWFSIGTFDAADRPRPHHTAISFSMLQHGTITMWEQWPGQVVNQVTIYVKRSKKVERGEIPCGEIMIPDDELIGQFSLQRNIKKAAMERSRTCKARTVRTITHTPSGQYWIYRPQKKK